MQVIVEQTAPCTLMLKIEVDEQQVARTFDAVYREFGRFTNVPGFRPGKAPRALLERYVDKSRVTERAVNKIYQDTFQTALQENDISPMDGINPEILSDNKLVDRTPFEYTVSVSLPPQITLGTYTGLKASRPKVKVSDEAVEKKIEEERANRARLKRVEGRGIQPEDMVIAEVREKLEGEEESDQPARRQFIRMGENVAGFDEAIMGAMPGEEREFSVIYPEEYEDEQKRGKKADIHVKVSSISGKEMPEVDEAFCREVANVDTPEELRKQIREWMEFNIQEEGSKLAEQMLLMQILRNSEVHYPERIVRDQAEDNLRRLAQQLRENRISYEDFLGANGITSEQHQSGVIQQAAVQVSIALVVREISLQEGLQPSVEDLEAEFERFFNDGVLNEEQFEEYRQDERRRMMLANALIEKRMHDFLFQNNTVEDVEMDHFPASEEIDTMFEQIMGITAENETEDAGAETASAETVEAEAETPAAEPETN